MRPTVSVVIPHFFKERAEHLSRIASDLRAGTVAPDEILVWNNGPAEEMPDLSGLGVTVLQSPSGNTGPQARFQAARQAKGDYLLFMDNDTTVCPKTLENLLSWVEPSTIITLEGRLMVSPDLPYRRWPKIYGHDIQRPQRVTMSLGRGELVWRGEFDQLLPHFPFGHTGTMDDLWWSACAAHEDIPIYVVPSIKGVSSLVNLPRYGTGASATKGYWDRRDDTIKAIRAWSPSIWRAAA